ncbi:MAG: hypothetical protein JXB62_04160 [Pirellulales bacterium]|nr:hypothetical protein [Pirellulales bacterium]
MNPSTPHYLLFSETHHRDDSSRWRFVLQSADGSDQFEASDVEPEVQGARLALLTVVRALENLDQPSQVTLVGCSPYVRQGMQYGLPQWRDNGWRWEFFGEMVPVRNGDLWRRLDRAMRFHRIDCHSRRPEQPQGQPVCPPAAEIDSDRLEGREAGIRFAAADGIGYLRRLLPAACSRWIGRLTRPWRQRAARATAPRPCSAWGA